MPGPAPAPDAQHQRKIIKYLQRGTISINLQIEDIIAKEPTKRAARDQKCIEFRQREGLVISAPPEAEGKIDGWLADFCSTRFGNTRFETLGIKQLGKEKKQS